MTERHDGLDVRWLAVTLGAAAAAWIVTVTRMRGMGMGPATTPGPFGSFLGGWTGMMAAMMLPGTAPAVAKHAATHRGALAAAAFVATYLAVWTLLGIAVYGVDRPHSTLVAGVATVVAGVYELTPLKRRARQRCRGRVRNGWQLGIHCVGSSINLMMLLLALGAMSLVWMSAIAGLVLVQKILPPRPAVDFSAAAAIVTFGVVILLAPSSIPGLHPSM